MDFNSILKKSLAVVNDNYQLAVGDVQEIVGGVDRAIKANAATKFGLGLTEVSADVKGTTFRVYFDTNVDVLRARMIDILFIRVPSVGYPISIGSVDKPSKIFSAHELIQDVDELKRLFASLLQNPESSLIQAIGFALRTQDDDEDEPPF